MSTLVSSFNLVKSIQELSGLGPRLSSTITLGVMVLLLRLIIEPEKIKPVAYILSVFVFGACVALSLANYYNFFLQKNLPKEWTYFDTKESGLLVGVSLFSIESISTIINSNKKFISKKNNSPT